MTTGIAISIQVTGDIVKIINLIIRREDFSGFRSGGIQESERNRCGSTRYAVNSGATLVLDQHHLAFAHQLDERTRIDVADTYAGNWRSRCNSNHFQWRMPQRQTAYCRS